VTQLGGTIRAESNDSLTRFTVTLPLDTAHAPAEAENLPD
jgi:signal transduction histidine kinase